MTDTLETRRAARAAWQSKTFRADDWAGMQNADQEFWLAIPIEERARAVWELSEELFALGDGGSLEPGLSRSDFRVVRR